MKASPFLERFRRPELRREFVVTISLAACMLVVFANRAAQGSGWNDFDLRIDGGYRILRANTFDIGLISPQGKNIYFPARGGKTGPVVGYIVTESHIFLKTTGQTPRNNFPGDTYVYANASEQYFFTVDRSNNLLTGPFSLAEFEDEPVAEQLRGHEWITPANPNPEGALMGQWMFLGTMLLMFGAPFLLIAGVVAGIILVCRSHRRAKSKLHSP